MVVVKRINQLRLSRTLKKLGFENEEENKTKFILLCNCSAVELNTECFKILGLYNLCINYKDIKRIIVFKTSFLINFNIELKNGELLAYGLLLKRNVSNLNKNILSKNLKNKLKNECV